MKIIELKQCLINQNKQIYAKKWLGLVLHHSATPDSDISYNWFAIRKYHIQTNGWRDIGYHFGIEKVKKELQVLAGRTLSWDGAHAQGFNHDYIGLCVVGNFDIQKPSPELWNYTLNTVRIIRDFYGFTNEKVLGHRETFRLLGLPEKKSCPGKLWDISKFRNEL